MTTINDMSAPDVSVLRQLTPLTDVSAFDQALKDRVLPILGLDSADPMVWDSALGTASVILEERLRAVALTTDGSCGVVLVNKVFGVHGKLAERFTVDSERQSYYDLFAGVISLIQSPSTQRLIDPSPKEGGVMIVLINLLLTKLESLR